MNKGCNNSFYKIVGRFDKICRTGEEIYLIRNDSFPQNPVGFGESLEKSGPRPAFSCKLKVTFPKLKFWESLMIV
jgi:hypothetical protein